MTSLQNQMPGGIPEVTNTPGTSNRSKRTKPSFEYAPTVNEDMTTAGQAERWGLGKKAADDAKTRGQRREQVSNEAQGERSSTPEVTGSGLDRPDTGGDRLKGSPEGEPQDLDRSGNPDGDQSGEEDLSQPEEDNDRSEPEEGPVRPKEGGERPEAEEGPAQPEGGGEQPEIEEGPVQPKEGGERPNTIENITTNTSTTIEKEPVNTPEIIVATITVSTPASNEQPSASRRESNDDPEDQRPKSPKARRQTSKDADDWTEIKGKEREERLTDRIVRKLLEAQQEALYFPKSFNSAPEDEEHEAEDVENELTGGMDFSEQSGSESSRQRRKKKKKIKERIKKEERDDVLRKLAKSGMTTQKRATSSRPMDEVEVTYNNKRNTPLSLAEMLSILLKKPENAVEELEQAEKRAKSKETRSKKTSNVKQKSEAPPARKTEINKPGSGSKDRKSGKDKKRSKKPSKKSKKGDNASSEASEPRDEPSDGASNSSSSISLISTSNSGSSSSNDAKKKKSKFQYKRVKMQLPESYDGRPDPDVFATWTQKIIGYMEYMGVNDESMIRVMSNLVTGDAERFYMKYVAKNPDNYTIDKFFKDLYDYCFPDDFNEKLRRQWDKLTQGKKRVREFSREVEDLARKFKEMSERQVVLKFWHGLHGEIRKEMVLQHIDPEEDELSDVIDCAKKCERALDNMRRQTGTRDERERQPEGGPSKPKREWTRFKSRNGGTQHFRPREASQEPVRQEKLRANSVSPQSSHKDKPRPGPSRSNYHNNNNTPHHNYPNKQTRSKLDTLRAEGRCFHCQEQGHEQRNCPKLSSMKPPRHAIKAGSIRFAQLDRLAEQKERADAYVGSMSVIDGDPFLEELREHEGLELRVHQMCEDAWGEDPLWYYEETRPDCKYSIEVNNEDITIWDFVNGGSRTFERHELDDPLFDLAGIFDRPEPDRIFSSVREGGYPDLGDYQRWDWPAINWMRARLRGQLEYVDGHNAPDDTRLEDRIDVQPTMWGYSIQLDESDVIYNITHEEVLDKHFSPEWIIDQMLTARNVPAEYRGDKFVDKRFTKYTTVMLGMTRIPGQQNHIKRRGNKKRTFDPEGVTSIERTSLRVKDRTRRLPEPIVVIVRINDQPIRALLDTGSMADFLSTTIVDQLKLPRETYEKPLSVQLAVHGSRSKINCGTTVRFQYQTIDCDRRFDVANLDNYDAILGTPFMYQHQVAIGFNPSRVIVGSSEPQEMKGPEVTTINSAAADLLNKGLNEIRKELRQEAEDLCPDTSRTALPPMRAVNHAIPLIDEKKIYRFRPSKCPEAFRDQWRIKKNAYLETGRWRTATGHNAIPLLMIPKPSTTNGQPTLQTVFDKREQNANTHKLASPLPDIEEILRAVSRHKYRSLIDGKDAYEQIRVIPEHVPRTIFTTPDGTMESLVMQQGDCNAGATYQTLMNHIFASYIGVFVYVYLDDIIIFSDSIADHVKHVRIVFNILRKEKLYLGPSKMQFFAEELKILGHIIDDKGISMDPHKVDKVTNWKNPTNKDLLRSFIGAVGFLAPDCKGIRVPMGHLSGMTSESRPWRWDDTAQRAFDEVKQIVSDH